MSDRNGHPPGPALAETMVIDELACHLVPKEFFTEHILPTYRPDADYHQGGKELDNAGVFQWGGVNWLVAGVQANPARAVCYTVMLESHFPGKRKAKVSPHKPGEWVGLGVLCGGKKFRLCFATAFVAEGKRRGKPSGN